MSGEVCWLMLSILTKPAVLLAQGRMYEWHWEMHPMWWWGWGMIAMMFLFWVLFIVGLVAGIRWLLGKGNEPAVVVGVTMVLEDEIIAIRLLVVSQISEIHTLHPVRLRQLVTGCVGGRRIVD